MQVFYSLRKETTYKPSKAATAKIFSPVYVIGTINASINVFYYKMSDNWETVFGESLSFP